jgi:hypothetical protein
LVLICFGCVLPLLASPPLKVLSIVLTTLGQVLFTFWYAFDPYLLLFQPKTNGCFFH